MAKLKQYDYDYFYQKYYSENMSTNDIATELGVAGSSIARKMRVIGFELRKPIAVNCHVCGKEISRDKNEVYGCKRNTTGHFFCSKECEGKHKSEAMKGNLNCFGGKTHTPETLRKISRANKGKVIPLEMRKRISAALSGVNSPHWKNGASERNHNGRLKMEYRAWRTAVFERDGYTCRKCGQVGKQLQAHHIKNFADNENLRFILSNGVTFCKACHKTFHSKYGNKNTTVKQYKEYLGKG